MTDLKNLEVIEYAARLFGKEKIGISTSGFRMDDEIALRLSRCVKDVEMTMDTIPGVEYPLRPKCYAETAAKAIPFLKRAGVPVGIQTVLARSNNNPAMLKELYVWLNQHGVDEWSLLAFFPSGRGQHFTNECLSEEEQKSTIDFLKQLDEQNTSACKVKLDFQFHLPESGKCPECRGVKKSIGILPDGSITSCFWAVGYGTKIVHPMFELGKVPEQNLVDILHSSQAHNWINYKCKCDPYSCLSGIMNFNVVA